MKLSGFPNLSIIKAMRGHVDFYRLNGQNIARRWPRIRMRAPSAAQLWARRVPAIGDDLRGRLPVYWWNAWNQTATPVGRTTWDTWTSIFYWQAHHHYLFPAVPPFIDVLNVPMMPVAAEVLPFGGTTRLRVFILLPPPFTLTRVLFHVAETVDGKPGNFAYVYTSAYHAAPSNKPPAYSWAWPRTITPLFFDLDPFLWMLEIWLPGDYTQLNFWTTFRYFPGESPIRTNPPTNPVWFTRHLPDWPGPGWPPTGQPWPWMNYWPPYYANL